MPTPEPPNDGSPRSAADVRQWLTGQLAKALHVDPSLIDPAAALGSFGLGSLAAIGLTGELAEWLGRDVPATLMWDYGSINAIAEGLANQDTSQPARAWPGVIILQAHGQRRPVFFFPGQGGHPRTFDTLATELGTKQPCYGLTVPGLTGEEEPRTSVEEIASAMVQNIRRVQAKGPYQFAGYSFGGLLAYEVAQQLVTQGETLSTLAIFDAFTPAGRKLRISWLRRALNAYRSLTGSDDSQENSSTSDSADGPDLKNLAKVSSANAQAAVRYDPKPYPGSVLVFRATDRAWHNIFYKLDPSCGWNTLAHKGAQVLDLPGTHAKLLSARNAQIAAQMLLPYLCE